MQRRQFFTRLAAGGAVAPTAVRSAAKAPPPGGGDRAVRVATLRRIADPVLENLAAGPLKQRMPVEEVAGAGAAVIMTDEARRVGSP